MSKLEQNLKKLRKYADDLTRAKRAKVAVGLPQEEVGGKIYGDGTSIIRIGAIHEYGLGNSPERSFLRVPFSIKADEVNDYIALQFSKIFEGAPVDKALGLVGIKAVNIAQGAFTSQGYGTWPDIKPETKQAKGSSQVLIDTGTLRNSISFAVRGL